MRRHALIALIVLGAFSSAAEAQDEATVAKQGFATILGVGARANAMGGAFIAIADDPTAASWNPAGLAHLDRNSAAVVWDEWRGEQITDFRFVTEADLQPDTVRYVAESLQPETIDTKVAGVNFLAAVYPLNVKWTTVIQGSYRSIGRFPSSGTRSDTLITQSVNGVFADQQRIQELTEVESSGAIEAYTMSIATQPAGKNYRAGASINLMSGAVNTRFYKADASPAAATWDLSTLDYAFRMITADVGVQYDIGKVIVGAVYHSRGSARLDVSAERQVARISPQLQRSITSPIGRAVASTKLHWPQAIGFGAAYKPNPRMVVSADYSITNWSSATIDELPRVDFAFAQDGASYRTLTGVARDAGYPYYTEVFASQNDTASVRFGAEYILELRSGLEIPLRAGYFVEDQILNSFRGSGPPKYRGITCGAGLIFGDLELAVAGVFTNGKDQYSPPESPRSSETFGRIGVSTSRVIVSAVIQFGKPRKGKEQGTASQ